MNPQTKEAIEKLLGFKCYKSHITETVFSCIETLLQHPEILALEGYHKADDDSKFIHITEKDGEVELTSNGIALFELIGILFSQMTSLHDNSRINTDKP